MCASEPTHISKARSVRVGGREREREKERETSAQVPGSLAAGGTQNGRYAEATNACVPESLSSMQLLGTCACLSATAVGRFAVATRCRRR